MVCSGGADLSYLAPVIDEFKRWRSILSTDFNSYRLQIKVAGGSIPLVVSPYLGVEV